MVEADVVLSATGRAPKVEGLGLENAGVKVNEKGAVMVDEWSRTSVPHIYAVGDVTDRVNLTPVALAEGTQRRLAVRTCRHVLLTRHTTHTRHDTRTPHAL